MHLKGGTSIHHVYDILSFVPDWIRPTAWEIKGVPHRKSVVDKPLAFSKINNFVKNSSQLHVALRSEKDICCLS